MHMQCSLPPKGNFKGAQISLRRCHICDYTCSSNFLMKQHLGTRKHRLAANPHIMLADARSPNPVSNNQGPKQAQRTGTAKQPEKSFKCACGRPYRHSQSYRRHAKTCPIAAGLEPPTEPGAEAAPATQQEAGHIVGGQAQTAAGAEAELREIIRSLVDQNKRVLEENRNMQEVVKEMLPRIGNNNTTFNLQVFLDETCKDAVNLSEFVAGLQLGPSELEMTRRLGFAGGVADIFVRGLRAIDLHRRPIHCSNLSREVLHVRDNDRWATQVDAKPRLEAAISAVARRQTSHIKAWEARFPDWNKTEEGTQRYISMVRSVTDQDQAGAGRAIINEIAKEVVIGGVGPPE